VREIALHLLDIAENSVAAQAKTVFIAVCEDLPADRLSASVKDDGKGMDAETLASVVDPFVTSRTTRKVGLGIPLLKAAAEACDGHLLMASQLGLGTTLEVEFRRSHIDRMPLGDLGSTVLTLVVAYPQIHWLFSYKVVPDVKTGMMQEFLFDDAPIKAELGDIPLTEPDVLAFFRNYLEEGVLAVQQHALLV